MIKLFLITIFLLTTLNARENPFFPSAGEKDIPFTSNENRLSPRLKKATISLPSHARVLKKVTLEFKNLDGSIEKKSIVLNNSIDWHLPVFISQSYAMQPVSKISKKNPTFKSVAKIKYADFLVANKSLKIITKDKQLRDFLLVQPHRIIIDFKRDTNMKSYIKNIKNSLFTKIRVGNHDGYYRVVIELDGYYRYKVKKSVNGYLIFIK